MRFTVYKDKRGEHRWRMRADNGRIIADSGEGYKTRPGAIKAVVRMFKAFDWGEELVRQHLSFQPDAKHEDAAAQSAPNEEQDDENQA